MMILINEQNSTFKHFIKESLKLQYNIICLINPETQFFHIFYLYVH